MNVSGDVSAGFVTGRDGTHFPVRTGRCSTDRDVPTVLSFTSVVPSGRDPEVRRTQSRRPGGRPPLTTLESPESDPPCTAPRLSSPVTNRATHGSCQGSAVDTVPPLYTHPVRGLLCLSRVTGVSEVRVVRPSQVEGVSRGDDGLRKVSGKTSFGLPPGFTPRRGPGNSQVRSTSRGVRVKTDPCVVPRTAVEDRTHGTSRPLTSDQVVGLSLPAVGVPPPPKPETRLHRVQGRS